MIIEHLPQFGIIGINAEVVLLAVFELAMSFITNNRHVTNLIARSGARIVDIAHLSYEFGVADFTVLDTIGAGGDHLPEHQPNCNQRYPQDHRFKCRIHE